jgi:phosphatidylglycerophosphatase A
MNTFVLWLAQGFGSGRAPFAPGTFGSLVGLVWFGFLLAVPMAALYIGGMVLGVALSVLICARAEKFLGQKDPSSVVLDEIVAVPICFASWLVILFFEGGRWPTFEYFFSGKTWPGTLAVFIAFRIFDVAKPWPVRQSQALPGGWGVTVDDVLAALYVNLCVLAFFAARSMVA